LYKEELIEWERQLKCLEDFFNTCIKSQRGWIEHFKYKESKEQSSGGTK